MATAMRRPAPWHLWAIGGVGLLWNGFGCYDYVMTKLSPAAYFKEMGLGPESVAYMESFPAWLTAMWALGVWGSLAGSILLFARSRHAVTAFALSLLGLAVSQGYQEFVMRPPQDAPLVMVVLIWAALLFFLAYSWRMTARGVLR